MDDLLAEISRKRTYVESKPGVLKNNKFFKRGDLLEAEKEEYEKKHAQNVVYAPKLETSPTKEAEAYPEATQRIADSMSEINARLRKRGHPIRLFGETDLMVFQRLKKIELAARDLLEGSKNDMKLLMEKMDHDSASSIASDSSTTSSYDVKFRESGLTFEQLAEKALQLNKHDYSYDSAVVLNFCQVLLELWGKDLNTRPLDEKKSQKGRLESARYLQTVDYLQPLMRKLKSAKLEEEILDSLTVIVFWTCQKEYVKANDAYLQMAIGNAPWPIGVTMHGIHARPGKDKLATKTIAHVLNDELQRKYVQASKRLITLCQKLYPTVPSKSVEFNA